MQRDQLLIYPTIQDWYKKDPITSSRILDDYYRIKETTVHKLITEILKHPPKSFHLVIAGRHDPPLPIATLRAQGRVTEIRTQDICFNVAETQTLLNQLLGIEVDPSTAAAVEEKTEGWVTGVRLAALSMRHGADIDARLLEPHVDVQYVMEYAIDTGNQIMLQTSQAFEAELALRQGRLSEASSWVKRFYPKTSLSTISKVSWPHSGMMNTNRRRIRTTLKVRPPLTP
jgi:hypothetical protein